MSSLGHCDDKPFHCAPSVVLPLDRLDVLREPQGCLLLIAGRLLIKARRPHRVRKRAGRWRGGYGR